MKINNKYKLILIIALFFIVIFPNCSKAATVSVGQVKSVKVESRTTTTLKIKWNKVSKATGYRIYIYNESTKKYEYYGQTTKTSITIKKLKSAQTYKIKVRAYRTVKGKKYYGKYSSILKAAPLPETTKNITMSSPTNTSVKISWSKVARASGYRVYIYDEKSKTYKVYGETSTNTTSMTIKNLTSGKTYKVKIKTYKKVDGKKYYGSYSSVATIATTPKQVKNLKSTKQTTSSITVTWDKVEGSPSYEVYLYSIYSNSFKSYGTTTGTSMEIKNLYTAKFYKICVKAYTQVDKKKFYGGVSNEIIQKTLSTKNIRAGIDVSHHQNSIDWKQVKNNGIEYAVIRIGNRGDDVGKIYEDKYFKENVEQALNLGMEVGIYFYSYAVTEEEAIEEAEWVINKLKEYNIEDKCKYIVYDFEDFGRKGTRAEKITKEQVNKDAIAFLQYVQYNDYTPILYGNINYLTNVFDTTTILSKVGNTKVWLANYNDKTTYKGDFAMWQYTDAGTIKGISGKVDLNVIYF